MHVVNVQPNYSLPFYHAKEHKPALICYYTHAGTHRNHAHTSKHSITVKAINTHTCFFLIPIYLTGISYRVALAEDPCFGFQLLHSDHQRNTVLGLPACVHNDKHTYTGSKVVIYILHHSLQLCLTLVPLRVIFTA